MFDKHFPNPWAQIKTDHKSQQLELVEAAKRGELTGAQRELLATGQTYSPSTHRRVKTYWGSKNYIYACLFFLFFAYFIIQSENCPLFYFVKLSHVTLQIHYDSRIWRIFTNTVKNKVIVILHSWTEKTPRNSNIFLIEDYKISRECMFPWRNRAYFNLASIFNRFLNLQFRKQGSIFISQIKYLNNLAFFLQFS